MDSEKSLYDKTKKLSSKIRSTGRQPTSSKKLSNTKVSIRPKKPELSVINVIEQISNMLRKEIHEIERRKTSGE